MNKYLYLQDEELEKLFAVSVYLYKEELFLPEDFFLTEKGKEYYRKAKIAIIENTTDKEFEEIIKNKPDLLNIKAIKQEIISRKKPLKLDIINDNPKEIILELPDNEENIINIWHPMFYGIVGLNGNGKTTFSIYLASLLSNDFSTCFFLLEDNTIYSKLNLDIKKQVKFYKTKDMNTLIEKVIIDNYDIVFIDALTSLGRYEMKNYLDRGNFIHNLENIVSSGKTVFLINHITKKAKTEKKKEQLTLVDAYSEEFINLIDIGFIINLFGDILQIKIEKNRMEYLHKNIFNFDFKSIYNIITQDKLSKIREIRSKIKTKGGVLNG